MTHPDPDREELERLLAATDAPRGVWITHNGGGRPNAPSSYVEIVTRDGRQRENYSAVYCWPWWEEGDDTAYTAADGILRWRPIPAPPRDDELAKFVRLPPHPPQGHRGSLAGGGGGAAAVC